MRFKAGLYEVLSNDEASFVHGNSDEIQTTHTKNVWLKDLADGKVSNIKLTNSAVPIRPGAKIGLAFFNGEIIAFKRSAEIPVKDPVGMKGMHNSFKAGIWAIFMAIFCSIPWLGYLVGIAAGATSLLFGFNLLGRYKKFAGDRLFAIFLLLMSVYVWFPVQSYHGNFSVLLRIYVQIAIVLAFGFLVYQLYKISIEKKYYKRAVAEITAAWKN